MAEPGEAQIGAREPGGAEPSGTGPGTVQPARKAEGAFRTIGELARETGLPQHILRFWETRFTQLRPLQRAGNRRYYRPEDAALVRRIDTLLNHEGYSIRGVQQLLAAEAKRVGEPPAQVAVPATTVAAEFDVLTEQLKLIRDHLAQALADDAR